MQNLGEISPSTTKTAATQDYSNNTAFYGIDFCFNMRSALAG